ncbi:hypothetical protein Tco_0756949 [Tanacetum coccineum]
MKRLSHISLYGAILAIGINQRGNPQLKIIQDPSQLPPRKRSPGNRGKQKTTELENNPSEQDWTELTHKIVHKKKPSRNHSSHASGAGADEGKLVTPGVSQNAS